LSNLAYSIGRIIIKCHHCGAILYKYAIGDRADKNKFNGPPVPKRVLGEFDDMNCPVCGAKLSVRSTGWFQGPPYRSLRPSGPRP